MSYTRSLGWEGGGGGRGLFKIFSSICKNYFVVLGIACKDLKKAIYNVMESRCKYLSYWNLLEFNVTQCLYQNFLLSRYGTV